MVRSSGPRSQWAPAELRALFWRLCRHWPGATIVFDAAGLAVLEGIGPQLAGLGAPIQWTIQGESDVASLGLSLLDVRPTLGEYPERWGEMAQYVNTPAGRNSTLLIEARLDPTG